MCNPWIDSLLLRILHIRMCWHPCGTSTTSGPGANERCATDSLLCASSFHLAQAQQTACEKLCAFRSRSPPRIAPKPSIQPLPQQGNRVSLARSAKAFGASQRANEWAFHANRFLSEWRLPFLGTTPHSRRQHEQIGPPTPQTLQPPRQSGTAVSV